MIANLLKFYKGYFHTILVFSPTVNSDEKWDWVKEQPLLVENKPLKKLIASLAEKQNENKVVQNKRLGTELAGLVNKSPMVDFRIPEECFYSDYDEDTLGSVMDEQMAIVKLLKSHGQSKHLANRYHFKLIRVLVIFDDLVGSSLFSNARSSRFKMLNTNHRHYSATLWMVSQAYVIFKKHHFYFDLTF